MLHQFSVSLSPKDVLRLIVFAPVRPRFAEEPDGECNDFGEMGDLGDLGMADGVLGSDK